MNQWWGYRHVNGTLQVKRYFDQEDILDARDSPFVARVVGPFEASSREDAIEKAEQELMRF